MPTPSSIAARPSILLAALGACALVLAVVFFAYAVHAQGQEVTPTRDATGDAPPAQPTTLQASAEHDAVTLTWTASTDQTVTHYAILRRDRDTDALGVFHVIESNAGPGTSYTDRSVAAASRYGYRAKAVSPTGVSQWSGFVKADTPAAPEPTPTPGLTPATLESTLLGYSEEEGAGTLEPNEVTFDEGATFRVTSVSTWPGVPGLVLTLTAGSSAQDAALADRDFILEADETVLVVGTAEFSFDDATLSHSDTTGDNGEYTGVVLATWLEGEPGLAAGETVAFRLERRDRPEEAQFTTHNTIRILVSNVGQGSDDSVNLGGNDHAQLFQTGANTGATAGWVLTSLIVVSEDTAGDDFDVEICEADDTTEFPTSTCTKLDEPGSFAAGNLKFTHRGIYLNANDNYVAVFKQIDTEDVTLDSTTSGGEDATGLTDWSIKNKFDLKSSGAWQQKGGGNEAIQITVNGYETPANQDATGAPVIVASAEGAPILFAEASDIRDGNGLPLTSDSGVGGVIEFVYSYQWIRVDGVTETNIGVHSPRYRLVDADIGKLIKVEVSFTDLHNYSETLTSLPFGPVLRPAADPSLSPATLVSNTGQTNSATANITMQYAQGFTLGDHGQGYEISSVSIELAAVPTDLTVSLWIADHADKDSTLESKLYDFKNPATFAVGANEFTAPAGVLLHQNVHYAIVLSDFGASLSIKETTSDAEDAGGETGAELGDRARVRDLGETGRWGLTTPGSASSASDRETGVAPNTETPVLRLAIKGSKRSSGILASTYAQTASSDQEIISVGDDCCISVVVGSADRYLIRGFSWNSDDTTVLAAGVTHPWHLIAGSTKLFRLSLTRNISGVPEYSAPQGATVEGGSTKTYALSIDWDAYRHVGSGSRTGHVLIRIHGTQSTNFDTPSTPGVTFSEHGDDVSIPGLLAAILGEPLHAMVQNLGQTDNSFHAVGGFLPVLSQGVTTGPTPGGYRLQGIGVNIEGSDSVGGVAQVPDNAASVSVAVYSADADGKPAAKLFDLLSPTEYAPGHSFFEAPAGTTLAASTAYVVVWSNLGGTWHRLQQTSSDSEDAGAFAGFSVADAFYRGTDIDSLTVDSGGNSLEIAVYGNEAIPPPKRVTGFGLHSSNSAARGIWGNDDTFWVANDGTGAADKLYAYNRSDGSRDTTADFDTLNAAGNESLRGVCSDGATMFVTDHSDDKIYAYKMSDTTRDSGKDVTLNSANNNPQGLWCDSSHLWVAEDNNNLTSKIFVYQRSDGSHASSLDIGASILNPSTTVGAINNNDQRGMWSNGTTLFVVDDGDDQIYGYKLSDRTRDDEKNLSLDTDNTNPEGLWFDGRVLWVVDSTDDKVYVYDLPGAQPDNTPAIGVPTLDATPQKDIELTADVSGITDSTDGVTNAFFHYQWIRVDGTDETELDGETGPSYTPTADDVGKSLKVRVIFDDDAGNQEYPRYSPEIGPVLGTPPTVSSVEITSTPPNPAYAIDSVVETTVNFSEAVDITGTPQLELDFAGTPKAVDCVADTNTNTNWMGCYYQVVAGDVAAGGVAIAANKITLNGGAITATGSTTINAVLAHAAVAIDANHKVDGIRPTLVTTGANAPTTSTDGTKVILTFSEDIGTVTPSLITIEGNSVALPTSGESISGPTVELTLTTALTDSTTNLTVALAVEAVEDGAGNGNLALAATAVTNAIGSTTATGGICSRSQAIQDAIMQRLGDEDSCSDVTLHHVRDLTTLHIYSRELQTLKASDLAGFISLKTLSISGANLQSIESGAFAPVNHSLRHVHFAHNDLQISDLSGLTSNLTSLSLAHNNISSLGANAFSRFTKLEQLNLEGNPITSLHADAFDGLTSLIGLYLGGYNPPYSSGTGKRRLILNADQFAENRSLQILNVSNSRIGTIPVNTFNNLGSLQALVLKDNNLTSITRNTFHADLGALRSLSLGCNRLTTASFSNNWTAGVDSLRDLYLHNNYLTEINARVLSTSRLPRMKFLSLENNPNLAIFNASVLQGHSRRLDILMFGTEWMELFFVGGPPSGWPSNVHADFHSDVRSCGDYKGQEPTFRVGDAVASESGNGTDSTMTFSVNLQYGDADPHNVEYHTQDGTATAGSDYTAASGTLTFAPDEYSKTVLITVKDDNFEDSGETFQLVLSNPTGGSHIHGTAGTATGTILNHDQPGVEASFPQSPYASRQHTGSSARPQVVVAFSEAVAAFGKYTPSVQVAGGTLDSVQAHAEDGIENAWLFVLAPDGDGDVTFELIPNAACTSGGICTAGGTPLIQVPAALTIPGPEETETSEAAAEVTARPNTPATGAPTASGTAQAGETLTADTSGITDEDGLTNVSYSYQWVADDTNIDGATNSAYTLTDADEGKTIKVKVSFTDDANNQETLTSAATAAVAAKPNTPATGAPTINGTAQVGETLTANTSSIADADGLTNVSYNYQWIRNDDGADTNIARETASAYTLVTADQGKTIRVEVSFTDDANNEETLTSAATVAVAPQSDNTVADEAVPVWSADMLVVEYSSVSIGAASADLFSNVGGSAGLQVKSLWSYTLGRDLRLAFTDGVPGAEDMTLQVGDLALAFPAGSSGESRFKWNDVDVDWEDGQTISVRIVPASATATVPPNTPATGLPTISGKAQVEETLTADTSGIADADGLTNVSYSYQWIRNDGTNDSDIGGQTGSTYTLTDEDVGKSIKVKVSFTDDAGNEETLTSAAMAAVAARPDTPATGAPTISGTAHPGETLTADTADIADEDGLDNATFSYQWITNDGNADTDIAGETGSTYEVSDDDVGKTVKVRVSFTDDRNNEETLTSAATATAAVAATPNSPATGLPTISGTAQVGQKLTADTSGITDADGLTNVSYSYQWIRNDGTNDSDIGGQTGSTYTLVSADEGKIIKVRVSFTDDAGNEETLTSAATEAVAARPNSPATGAPTISRTAQVDQTLTADTSGITDADGLTNVSYSYQWIRNDGTNDSDIGGQTGSTYTLVSADEGKIIKVRVSFTDDAGNEETLTSAATAAVAARPNTPATGLPTISGTVQVDQTLTADVSSIADADGLTNVSYSYQWIRNDGTNDSDMDTSQVRHGLDLHPGLRRRGQGHQGAGELHRRRRQRGDPDQRSDGGGCRDGPPNTYPATGLPTISGTAQVDETLTADTSGISDDSDGLTNVSYSYQWIRNDGTNDADIGGQTGSTYTLVSADEGKTIKVRVSFTDDAGNEETLTSAATAAVAARPNTPATGLPTISGTAQVGKTLTANISGMADEDGLDNAEFSYQWLANDADIQNATDSTYTLTDDDVGKTIKVRVSFTDDRSNDETLTSAATDTVVAKPDSPDTDAPPRDPGATVDVTVGNTVTGEIEEAIEVDWFKVSLLASETYQIDMRGAWGGEWARIDGEIVWVAPGTLHDPKLLGVFSAANVLVPGTDEEVSGDDRGDYEEGKNSRITSFSPPADGYYYIAAAAEAAWTGTYELTVTVVADE